MNLFIRLFWVIIRAMRRSRIGLFDASSVPFVVLPNDVDLNMHMNNARYLSLMDLGRVDLIVRTGLGRFFVHDKWQAILGAANIRFRRALKPFQSYELVTQIVAVDEKWAYIEQRFHYESIE